MATRVSKSDLLQRIIAAVKASGWNAIVLSSEHPFKLSLFRGEQRVVVLCYIWNMTHGGLPSVAGEMVDTDQRVAEVK